MGRPKGYKMSNEAKAKIGAATRERNAAKKQSRVDITMNKIEEQYQDALEHRSNIEEKQKEYNAFWEGSEPKKKWWEFLLFWK